MAIELDRSGIDRVRQAPASYRRVSVILADVSLEKDGRYWDRWQRPIAKRSAQSGSAGRADPGLDVRRCKRGLPHVASIEASDTKATPFVKFILKALNDGILTWV
jgi:hypothetical protein